MKCWFLWMATQTFLPGRRNASFQDKRSPARPVTFSYSNIPLWRPDLAAAAALSSKTPSGEAAPLRRALEKRLEKVAWTVRCLCSGTMPLYGNTAARFQPRTEEIAMETCPSLYPLDSPLQRGKIFKPTNFL